MIYFEANFSNERKAAVCIRKMTIPHQSVYAYEIEEIGRGVRRRGTVEHEAKQEDFTVVIAVLSDYVRQYGG